MGDHCALCSLSVVGSRSVSGRPILHTPSSPVLFRPPSMSLLFQADIIRLLGCYDWVFPWSVSLLVGEVMLKVE